MGDEPTLMTPAPSEQSVFAEAILLPTPEARTAFLVAACGTDAELRERVEALLRAAENAGNFLEEPPTGLSGNAESTIVLRDLSEKPGDKIGRYKLLQQIGEGGCGVVYMAEQEEPVRRRVALKVIKLGMDTKSVIARFEAERQALALMDHPNIAKVLDAGATETGRPYFVMELVRGIKITDYCDENNLSTEERLKLFTRVCQAIQHAHQKGIIHRDIKPSNILVTLSEKEAVPKVIDFGIAKATTDQRLTDKTVFTAFEQFLGTPAYMSPEQAMMTSLDIDTRTDIYALGVLLYELLTGQTPFDAKGLMAVGLDAMRRTIREQEPVRPSTRLSTMLAAELTTVAQHRHSEPGKLGGLLRGDLDWIVMKALEKDRTRRYETANGLAMDIERHLKCEPVMARPPSRLYEFQKTVRRHKFGFAAGATLIAVLALGLLASGWQALRATRAEKEQNRLRRQAEEARIQAESEQKSAQIEASKSRQVAQFMRGMLEGVGPSAALGRDTTMLREILERTARRLNELKDQPAVEADMRTTLGQVYFDLGEFSNAAAMHSEALALRKKLLGEVHPEVASALHNLAVVQARQGRLLEAEAMHRDVLAMRRKLFGSDHSEVAQTLQWLGNVLRESGKHAEAEAALREALAILKRLRGNQDASVGYVLHPLAWTLNTRGKHLEAETLSREEQAIWRRLFGDNHHNVGWALGDLAIYLTDQGRLSEAEAATREALSIQRLQTGSNPGGVGLFLRQLGWVLHRQGKPAEAEAVVREEVALARKVFGQEHPGVADALSVLAGFLRDQGKLVEAETTIRQSLTILQARLGYNHGSVVETVDFLTGLLRAQNKLAELEDLLREQLAWHRKTTGAQTPDEEHRLATTMHKLAELLRDSGRLREAEEMFREALAIRRNVRGNEHEDVGHALHLLAWTLYLEGRSAEAEGLSREELRLRKKLLGNQHLEVAATLRDLGAFLRSQRKLAEAEAAIREELEIRNKQSGDDHPETAETMKNLAEVLGRRGRLSESKRLLLQAAEHGNANTLNEVAMTLGASPDPELRDGPKAVLFAEKAVADTERKNPFIMDTLAVAYAEVGQFTNAVRAQQEAMALLKDTQQTNDYASRLRLYQLNRPYRLHHRLSERVFDLLHQGRFPEAERFARELLVMREILIPDDWQTFNAQSLLGASLLGQHKFLEAEPLLLSGHAGLKQRENSIPVPSRIHCKAAAQRLARLYEAMEQPDKAAEWNKQLAASASTEAAKPATSPNP